MSAINNIPKVSSSIFSFTRVFPLTEYTHIGSILKSTAPVSSCNSLLAVSKILLQVLCDLLVFHKSLFLCVYRIPTCYLFWILSLQTSKIHLRHCHKILLLPFYQYLVKFRFIALSIPRRKCKNNGLYSIPPVRYGQGVLVTYAFPNIPR